MYGIRCALTVIVEALRHCQETASEMVHVETFYCVTFFTKSPAVNVRLSIQYSSYLSVHCVSGRFPEAIPNVKYIDSDFVHRKKGFGN